VCPALQKRPISVALAPLYETPTRLQASFKTFCVIFVAGNSNTAFEVVGAVNIGASPNLILSEHSSAQLR
jgi:hypothetical protein